MLVTPVIISILLVLVVSAILVVSGLKKAPGIGVIAAVVIIVVTLILRRTGLGSLGFAPPHNWLTTILLGLGLGVVIQVLSITLIEPLCEKLTGVPHDHSALGNLKGNWKGLVQLLLLVWVVVALLEEGIFRGFLMTEIARATGVGAGAISFSVIFSSVVFGLAHGYQGRSGILSTGLIGALLALIFVFSGFNLWLAVFTHGFIDTVGIGLMAVGGDQWLRRKVWPLRGG